MRRLKPFLNGLGVKHVAVFGSVARQEDEFDSDIDLYIDYGFKNPTLEKMLQAEGKILDIFPKTNIDFVTDLKTPKGSKLKGQIEKNGRNAF